MVRRRSTVRFRKGAPGYDDYSNIYPVTSDVSGALRGHFSTGHGAVTLGRCEFAGHVSGSEGRIGQLPGSGGPARPKLATLCRASYLIFGTLAALIRCSLCCSWIIFSRIQNGYSGIGSVLCAGLREAFQSPAGQLAVPAGEGTAVFADLFRRLALPGGTAARGHHGGRTAGGASRKHPDPSFPGGT